MKNFDLEYKLEQFRKEHLTDLFDENGKKYTGVGISNSECETMLELINELEKEVEKFENCIVVPNNDFNKSVEPAIRYLLQNHNPHTSIYIHYDTAELLTGEKCHNLSNEVPD